jgi:transcriptional regulator of arginine metabolism
MKPNRHAQILKLIREYDIETQEELAKKLNETGFPVTQATVSRDIRELKLTKLANDHGGSRYALMENLPQDEEGRFIRVLKDSFVSMDTADSIVVIKTAPGMAMAAASVLDELRLDEIVGSIAGDNTIMCAARSHEDAVKVMKNLRKMLERI